MIRSRRIWAALVLLLAGLWVLGGIAALISGEGIGWIYLLPGLVLLRLGNNLRRPTEREEDTKR